MDALLVDAHGTLLHLVEPVEQVYTRVAAEHGVHLDSEQVRDRLRAAMRAPDPSPTPDGRSYWRQVVAASTGSSDPALFEALYDHYASPSAWRPDDMGTQLLRDARATGIKTGMVSNFDDRLLGLLDAFGLSDLLDTVVLSGEVGTSKPSPEPFLLAMARIGAQTALYVGDHPRDDVAGAIGAGLSAVLLEDDSGWAEARASLGL